VLPPPTPEQRLVLDAVGQLYLNNGRWPRWSWVEELLDDHELDALTVYRSFPTEFSVQYGYLGTARVNPGPNDRVHLTILGLSHVEVAHSLVRSFLHLVSAFGTARRAMRLDPFADDQPIGRRESVLAGRTPSLYEPLVIPLLTHEPPTWRCEFSPSPDAWETVSLPAALRRFAGVQSVDDYLERLASWLLPATSLNEEPLVSPFSLPAAIDYLDAVWQLRYGERLVSPPGVERSARLAFTATSAEEADSRLSALAELLGGLRLPPVAGGRRHALVRLQAKLDDDLPSETHDRVHDAIAVLNAARIVRVGAQHQGASPETRHAVVTLGLDYPIADWPAAWQHIQNAAANAFNAIRDELHAAPEGN
jgi:hypothetical protein